MLKRSEGDLSLETNDRYESLAHKVINSLAKNNIEAEYVTDCSQALTKVIEAIPQNATIGIGDSVTLHQIGLFTWLEKERRKVFDPFARNASGERVYKQAEVLGVMRQAMTADVFLASSNAVTLDGKLVSIDGRGNRVAAMLFGPLKTILVIGANKIVRNVDEAMTRIKFIAAPMNVRRHVNKHSDTFLSMGMELSKIPCFTTGACIASDIWGGCAGPDRACRKIVIIAGQERNALSHEESGISVIIVGESLGI